MNVKKISKIKNSCCPKCGSEEFITEPNQYDVLFCSAGQFDVKHCEGVDDFKIFCRECGGEVDDDKSSQAKRVVLK